MRVWISRRWRIVALFAWLLIVGIGQLSAVSNSADRIAVGEPQGKSRLGVMKVLGGRVRSLIAPGACMEALALLAALAAAYGVLHALGPGHQKTLITGYLLSEGGGVRSVIRAAFVSAASHAVSVIALFGGLQLLRGGLDAAEGELGSVIVTRLSASLLALLAARMVFLRIRSAYARFAPKEEAHPVSAEACACRAHDRHGGRRPFATIVAGSLVPCPGAAFFLLYGFSAGNPWAGALAVLAISAGMWATLVAVGLIAAATREAGYRSARDAAARDILRSVFEIGGSLLVLAFALLLL